MRIGFKAVVIFSLRSLGGPAPLLLHLPASTSTFLWFTCKSPSVICHCIGLLQLPSQNTKDKVAEIGETDFLTVPEAGGPRPGLWQGWFPLRMLSPPCRRPPPGCCPDGHLTVSVHGVCVFSTLFLQEHQSDWTRVHPSGFVLTEFPV